MVFELGLGERCVRNTSEQNGLHIYRAILQILNWKTCSRSEITKFQRGNHVPVPGDGNAQGCNSPCSYPLSAFSAACPAARGAVSRSKVARDSRHSDLRAHSVLLLLRRLWALQLRWSRSRLLEPVLCRPLLWKWIAMGRIFYAKVTYPMRRMGETKLRLGWM